MTTAPRAPVSSTADSRWRMSACAVFAMVCLGCWLTYDPLQIMNDATQAISVADHLVGGEGLRTGIIYYEEQYATGDVPAPQTVFPPGYPALIAAVSLLGMSTTTAAATVVSFCLAAIAVLILWTARRMSLSLPTAIIMTLGWCGCVQAWDLTQGLMSEMPFIAFTLLSLLLFPDTDRRMSWLVFLSGCAAAAAFTMRYAGVFWFITVAGFYAVALRERFWTTLQSALLWGSVPLMTVAALFWRNHHLSGEWTGGNSIGSQRSLSFTLTEMYYSISHLIGWSKSQFVAGGTSELLALSALTAGTVWIVFHHSSLRFRQWSTNLTSPPNRLMLSAGYIVTTLVLLVYLDSRTPIGLGPRKLLPLLPFTLLVAATAISSLRLDSARARRWMTVPVLLMLASLVVGQLNVRRYVTSKHPVLKQLIAALQTPVEDATLLTRLQATVTPSAPLLTNEPHFVGHLLERPVLGLPSAEYTDRVWTESEVHKLVDAYGVQQITLFPDVLAMRSVHGPFFDELIAGDVPHWLQHRTSADDVLWFDVIIDGPVNTPPTDILPATYSPVSADVAPSFHKEY